MGKAELVEANVSLLSQPKYGASKQSLLLTVCVTLSGMSLPTVEETAVDYLLRALPTLTLSVYSPECSNT